MIANLICVCCRGRGERIDQGNELQAADWLGVGDKLIIILLFFLMASSPKIPRGVINYNDSM